MNHLHRDLAPISQAGWAEIEKEAKRTLKTTLAARRLVDFVGPTGWSAGAVPTGRSEAIDSPGAGIAARLRRV
ncbi:MAG: encapsulin, partial [Stellaceae bacterium]